MPSDHPVAENPCPPSSGSGRFWTWLVLAALLGLITWLRLGLAPTPLERDEGEYALLGQLMRQGIPPYAEAANMKFPGTYAVNAVLLSVFGETPEGIHRGLLVVNLATILLVYGFTRSLLGRPTSALLAAVFYGFATLSYAFLGPMAHATHFVVFFGLAGLFLLLPSLARPSLPGLWLAGVATGLACLCKQSGFYFVPAGLLLLASAQERPWASPRFWRALAWFLIGAATPVALMIAALNQLGVLDGFVFWTFRYASTYGPSWGEVPGILARHFREMTASTWGWFIFIPALLAFFPGSALRPELPRGRFGLLAGITLLSLGGVALGLYFRAHYWIQALPFLAMLAALFCEGLAARIARRHQTETSRWATSLALALGLGYGAIVLAGERRLLFAAQPEENLPVLYGGQPFREARQIADYIRQHSRPDERIFVFGCEPEIYFYAHRRPAVDNLYVCYNLLQPHRLQHVMLRKLATEFARQPPRYFVEADVRYFTTDASRQSGLYQWRTRVLREQYHPLFKIDMYLEGNDTINASDVLAHVSQSGCYLTVWERNPEPPAAR